MSHIEHKNVVDLLNNIFEKDWSLTDYAQGATFETINQDGFDEYFIRNIFKKASNLDLGIDPEQAALADFLEFLELQEQKVVQVSAILENPSSSPVLAKILGHARKTMKAIFKDFHPALIKPRFTLGSTLTLPKGSSVFARVKASEGHQRLKTNFEALYEYSETLLESYPHTSGDDSNYVKISVVPKTAKIGRVIGSPPSSMLAFQCGMGDYMVKKLQRFCKIDLKTAQSLHRSLAMEHSLLDVFSTLDQRKASDNILRILAFDLLPKNVSDYINAISPSTLEVEGKKYHTHMLCAAGNGFNTAFQTLLFWVLIKAIQKVMHIRQPVYVYGDDVIAHNSVYDGVCKVFPLLGLEINQDKSFKSGPFRESCGGDYLYGNNIRAFYADKVPENTIDWIRFANGIRRIGYYNNADVWRSYNIQRLWFWSILHIPEDERLFCPRHYGDAGLNTENSVLYQFTDPIRWDRERLTKYPGEGYDDEGRPYGSERIRIYVSTTSSDKNTFAEESKGLASNTVLRLVTHASVKNSGSKLRRNPKLDDKLSYYPAVYGGKFEGYKAADVAFTLTGQAPEDIDDLFAFIAKGNGSLICNSDSVVERYNQRRAILMSKLISLLSIHNANRVKIRDEVLQRAAQLTL